MQTSSDMSINPPEIQKKIELLKAFLWKYDKDLDDEIDFDELMSFFDDNLKEGEKYDREIARKIFTILDLDSSGKVSSEEFIKTFIHIEEELKSHKSRIKAKYISEKEKLEDIERRMKMNEKEELSREGVCENSKLECELKSVEFKESQKYSGVRIRLRQEDSVEMTRIVDYSEKTKEINLNKRFEFKIEKKTPLYFDVIRSDSIEEEEIIGVVSIDLKSLEAMDEYLITLEVPKEESENKVYCLIKCCIKFIWSYKKYYEGLFEKTSQKMKAYKQVYDRNRDLYENMNKPFDSLILTDYYSLYIASKYNKQSIDDGNVIEKANTYDNTCIPYNEDKGNNYKSTKKSSSIKQGVFILLIFLLLLISILNSVVSSASLIECTVLSVIFYISFFKNQEIEKEEYQKRKKERYFKMIYTIIGLQCIDILRIVSMYMTIVSIYDDIHWDLPFYFCLNIFNFLIKTFFLVFQVLFMK